MLYANTTTDIYKYKGHVHDLALTDDLNSSYKDITEIQADGDELVKCCGILGRNRPNTRVYTFLGNNAQEIACNWDSN